MGRVSSLNNEETEGGGFWLPNIQRPFVWSEEQISRLFDSIMREYPISTLLVWKTKEPVKHRRFIDNYHHEIKLTDFYVAENARSKMMVLDGQQRLQSLFIGLKGSYSSTSRELYLDILSGDSANPEDIRHRFAFLDKSEATWPWIRFKDIIFTTKLETQIASQIKSRASEVVSSEEIEIIELNVGRARQEFVNNDNITFQELDGIDNPDAYRPNDIVEIFIRANSGGTKLSKSDLLFSLLISSWEEADGEIEALLEDVNKGDFEFDRDFVLKCCLSILGKGAKYDVDKFRDGKTKEEIVLNWDAISQAIKGVRDFVVSKTYIRSGKALPSYSALIPLIYYRYHFAQSFSGNRDLAEYLLRSLITGVFGGSPDSLIDKVVRNIQDKKDFILDEIFGVIRDNNRSIDITREIILQQSYTSRTIHLFFNLWYLNFDYTPALDANGPQIDHIFPQSLIKTVRLTNPESGTSQLVHYRAEQRDQIANCMLLTAAENGPKGKRDTPPIDWFNLSRFASEEDRQRYFQLHLIPNEPELWKLENFEKFVEARKLLIIEKFQHMLRSVPPPRPAPVETKSKSSPGRTPKTEASFLQSIETAVGADARQQIEKAYWELIESFELEPDFKEASLMLKIPHPNNLRPGVSVIGFEQNGKVYNTGHLTGQLGRWGTFSPEEVKTIATDYWSALHTIDPRFSTEGLNHNAYTLFIPFAELRSNWPAIRAAIGAVTVKIREAAGDAGANPYPLLATTPSSGDSLSVVLWNIAWASLGSDRGAYFVDQFEKFSSDVMCITEGDAEILPSAGHVISSEADYGYPLIPGRRKVLLWSRNPWRDVDALGSSSLPSGRFIAGTTDTPLGPVRFVGVCIPWASAHVSTGQRNRKQWEDHETYLRHLPSALSSAANDASLPVVLLGDFNQRIPRGNQPQRVFTELSSILARGYQLATGGRIPQAPSLSIDHLAVNNMLEPIQTEFVNHLGVDGTAMSDHFGLRILVKRRGESQ
ncbi:hypothetical protein DB346_10070 [Verrucomicrobia bacterium LW23]|nr:hypothetical protein DB346_10070 [Verrucomicrobia bacterium LW23]